MNILSIDIGSYSVKFTEIRPERKTNQIVNQEELVLDDIKCHYPNIQDLPTLQKEIVANFVQKKAKDCNIIFQIPSEMITTRYLDIPAPSRKKAEMIIPFQLDDNLPYSLSDTHYASVLTKIGNQFKVISNIAQASTFDNFYNSFKSNGINPSIITSELSVLQNYLDQKRINENCCLIDIGHKTTKVYFVKDRRIVSNHISHVAGSNITDVISKTYQISNDDAVIYKHENAYFLTDDQMQEVSEEQKDFALLMRQIFSPLIADLKRWDIGHRVKFGSSASTIYLLGGTSEINNIDKFLESHLGIPVSFIAGLDGLKNDSNPHDRKQFVSKLMAISATQSNQIINFLTGKYQPESQGLISPYSTSFLASRVAYVCLILCAGLLVERFAYFTMANKKLDQEISTLLKRSNLGLTQADKKAYKKTPTRVLSALTRKEKNIKEEIAMISSSQDINALKSLGIISQMVSKADEVLLESYTSDEVETNLIFSAENTNAITKLRDKLQTAGLKNLSLKMTSNDTKLMVRFEESI